MKEGPYEDIPEEVDFTGAARGKHIGSCEDGHTVEIHHADGTTSIQKLAMKADLESPEMIYEKTRSGRAIDTAIFDMDGLLIDSEPLWRLAERRVFAAVGLELSDAQCMETMGLRTDEVVAYWYRRRPWRGPDPAEVERRLLVTVAELVAEHGEALPGVEKTLDGLEAAGHRLALASSSPPLLIEAVLDKLGLTRRFELTCSAAHEKRGKPDPAVYLTTARRLGVEPGCCVAFEDSPAGVRSAHAAGMKVVAVPHHDMRGHEAYGLADHVLDSLLDFRLDLLGPPPA